MFYYGVMGRGYQLSKNVAENYFKLSIYEMRQQGFFTKFYSGDIAWLADGRRNSIVAQLEPVSQEGLQLRLLYTQTNANTGQKQEFNYIINLTTTPCYFGELRYWFRCPLIKNGIKCNRRVGVLYKGGDYFGCRHCYNLSYRSCNENPRFRGYPWRDYSKEDKVEQLYKRMKTKYYAGKPTKAYRRILQLEGSGLV
jgi:hypothetical protein